MTQEKFDELRAALPLGQDKQAAFVYYNIIANELAKEGYTKIVERNTEEPIKKNLEDLNSPDCGILLSHIQHFFKLNGFKTKAFKDTHTAYIFSPDAKIVGILIENDFQFK